MYVNIQERFVFPVVFIVLILGVAGWETFRAQSTFWNKRTALWKGIRNGMVIEHPASALDDLHLYETFTC
jgi:hypothetical protein